MTDNAPGWQPDPTGRFEHRYWDGSQWTDNVANAGVASSDPYDTSGATGLDETAAVDSPADAGAGDPTLVGTPADAADTGWAAPTAAQPSTPADQTAAWPASPPPPSFTPNTGPPPVASSGGSKRGLLIGGGILAVVVLAIGAFLLLGGDDEDDEVRTDLVAALGDEFDLSHGDAGCLADAIIDEVGTEDLEGEDFSNQPDAVSDELLADSLEGCDIDEEALGGDDDPITDDDGGEGGASPFAPGELPEDFGDMFEGLGLTEEQSQCLVDKFSKMDPDISEEAAMSSIFGVFEDCDIDPSEITGG